MRRAAAVLPLILLAACSRRVRPGDAVEIRYELSAGGKVLESNFSGAPVEVYQGTGDVPPGVDAALVGMKPGEAKSLVLPPAEAFGPYDPAQVSTVTLASLGDAGRGLKAGRKILGLRDGRAVTARVLSVSRGKAVLDFNKPLAGETVGYRVQVVSTRRR
ncbi:MAG: FKBP-type peptidyl-prolyl cis-trans isomerase [Elusimicrobia bacterium]|nr:FKBP-type peptidyl-prolyl cis-trans isomerase [Elusimicrobiota bacterium]